MLTIGQGGTLRIDAETTDGAGDPTDCTALSLTILDPSSSIVSGFPVSIGSLTHDGAGRYHYNWIVDSGATIGTYTASWAGTLNGGPISGTESISVVTAGSISFAPSAQRPLSYLTPARYRAMALGIDLSAKSDAELASLIASASAAANRFCAAPRGFDFRGGTVTGEEHQWETGNAHKSSSGKLWPYMAPIKDVSLLRIYVSKTQYIDFTSSMLATNKRLGYIEPIAAPITTALFAAVPPWLLDPPLAYIDYTYGQTFDITSETLYQDATTSDWRALNQYWTDADVSVSVDGVTAATSTYEVDRTEGTIAFSPLISANAVVLASYSHTLPSEIPLATGIIVTDLLGYSNINASGLTGLSGIRVEEIELKQSARSGFANYDLHPAAKALLGAYVFASWG